MKHTERAYRRFMEHKDKGHLLNPNESLWAIILEVWLLAWKECEEAHERKVATFSISLTTKTEGGEIMYILRPGIPAVATLANFKDKDGNPTTVPDGSTFKWTSSDPTIAAVTASADGQSATVANAVPVKGGPFQVNCEIDQPDGGTALGSAQAQVPSPDVATFDMQLADAPATT